MIESEKMPEIIYHVACSLDGFIADKDGKVDWLNNFNDGETMEDLQEFFSSFEGIALGGHTYDFALSYGQWMSPDTPSWVFTSRDLKILDPSIQLTQESPTSVCQEMDKKGIKRVWLMGGGKLAASFLESDLIDEVNLSIIPIILGEGIRLFGNPNREPKLTLNENKQYSNGIVSVAYRVE